LKEETITIEGIVKNHYRIRKILIPNVVSWILRRARISPTQNGLVISDYSDYHEYSHAVKRELRRWNPGIELKPKDLRNTLQTEAIDGGWYGYYVQRYVGHAPTTIGEKPYHGDKGKRMLPLFREKVVSFLEAEIANWEAPVDTPILPGPRLAVNR
jgi:hypothetical protein